MNENKIIKNLKTLNIVLLTLLLCVALAVIPIYAWYCYLYSSPKSVIRTGNSADLVIEQTYCTEYLKQDGTVESYVYTFVPVSITPADKRPTGDDATAVNFEHFKFGSVINVHSLTPANYVYICIQIPTTTGGDVSFNFSYNNDMPDGRYSFWSGMKTSNEDPIAFTYMPKSENTELYEGLYGIENGTKEGITGPLPFIEYAYAFSDTKVNTQAALEGLSYIEGPNANTKYTVKDEPNLIEDTHSVNTSNEYYYLYVRMIPNLDAFVESLDYISTYMPCQFDFNLTLNIDITHEEE